MRTTTPVRQTFDYDALDPEVATEARAAAARIRTHGTQAAVSIVEMGRELIAIKEKLGHGNFGPWLQAEFRMSDQTADNWIRVTRVFGDKIQTVWNLAPTTLYLLSAKSTPEPLREALVERLESGETVSDSEIKTSVAEARATKKADIATKAEERAQPEEAKAEELGAQPKVIDLNEDQEQTGVTPDEEADAMEPPPEMAGPPITKQATSNNDTKDKFAKAEEPKTDFDKQLEQFAVATAQCLVGDGPDEDVPSKVADNAVLMAAIIAEHLSHYFGTEEVKLFPNMAIGLRDEWTRRKLTQDQADPRGVAL